MAGAETACNFVLGSKKSSTYLRGYAAGFFSPAAALAAVLSARFTGNISS